jgi:hypothetical protein
MRDSVVGLGIQPYSLCEPLHVQCGESVILSMFLRKGKYGVLVYMGQESGIYRTGIMYIARESTAQCTYYICAAEKQWSP